MAYFRFVRQTGWWALMVSATLVALVSFRYGLPSVAYPLLTNFVTHRHALVVHAVSASIALIVGPWQFAPKLRMRWPWVHRYDGRLYAAAVIVAWLSSIPIALHAETGVLASVGFLALGIAWVGATGIGIAFAVRRRIDLHRRWMIRSYALTAAAITLRFYLGFSAAAHIPFIFAYPAIAWLCWVPNLLVVEIALLFPRSRRNR